jgi:hypothetical protein
VRRLQGGSHEFRGDAAITHGLRHLGMLDDHRAARQAVLQQDAVTLDLRREFMPISVMTNLQFHMPSPPPLPVTRFAGAPRCARRCLQNVADSAYGYGPRFRRSCEP